MGGGREREKERGGGGREKGERERERENKSTILTMISSLLSKFGGIPQTSGEIKFGTPLVCFFSCADTLCNSEQKRREGSRWFLLGSELWQR